MIKQIDFKRPYIVNDPHIAKHQILDHLRDTLSEYTGHCVYVFYNTATGNWVVSANPHIGYSGVLEKQDLILIDNEVEQFKLDQLTDYGIETVTR